MTLSIVADLGGTNTRVALAEGGRVDEASLRRFSNREYNARGQDIADILADYLRDTGAKVDGVCVAVAGPVQDGSAAMTNLAWTMDGPKLSAATGAGTVALLNDLQAQGHALGHIAPEKLRLLMDGPDKPGAPMLVVGLGTGVNAAPVHDTARGRVVAPSECGHVNMPVRNDEDFRLMRFIEALVARGGDAPHAGVEEVLAGRGLANLYSFAASEAGVAGGLNSDQVLAGLAANDPVCVHAAQLYTRILAQMLADLALIHLPYGGIYLIGGMSRAMTPHLPRFGLTEVFRENRRVDLLTRDFTIRVVEDDFAALTGCAFYLASLG
jgi:glucokinase